MTHSDEYLFLMGDVDKVYFPDVQMLKWATMQWVNNTLIPQLMEQRGRSRAVCEVHQCRLFVFGGKAVISGSWSSQTFYHQTSEVIYVTNFLDNTWNYTASLTHPLELSRSAVSGDFIYIVSGSYSIVKRTSFHIFDVTTDTMTRYVFGGSQQTNTWLYL
eukprot:778321_1